MNTLGNLPEKFNNYNKDFLNKRHTALFVTIPQTTINTQNLHDKIIQYRQVKYALFKKEEHKDLGHHIHILLKFKQQVKINSIHNIIMETEGQINGSIEYKKPDHIGKCISYLHKQETALEEPIEYGERPVPVGRPQDEKEQDYKIAIEQAENGQLDEALETIKKTDPKEYLKFKETFRENLNTENKVRKYYNLPDYSKAKLTKQQQEVYNLLQTTPKPRRIIWVSGEYGAGKSFLYQYIKSNHEYLMYDAGQSASLDNVAYGYDQEGVIAWDLPRTFDFEEKGDHIANVIEKFSDFGQSITSKKYKGKTQQVRGHTIVFSNNEPIHQLSHRDIVHIHLEKGEASKKDDEQVTFIKKQIEPHVEHEDTTPSIDDEHREEVKVTSVSQPKGESTVEEQPISTPITDKIMKIEYQNKTIYKVKIQRNNRNVIATVKTLEQAESIAFKNKK